jgi:hypothetical protein
VARDPLRLLFAALVVETVLVALSWLAPPTEMSFAVQRWLWFALGAAEVGAIAWLRRVRSGAPSEQLWLAALIAAVIDAALGFWSPGGSFWLAGLLPMLAGVVAWILLWLALARDAGPDRGAKWTPLFIGLALLRVALSTTRLWSSMHRTGPSPDLESLQLLGWLSLASSIAARVLLLIPIFRLMTDEEGPVAPRQRL